MSVSAYVCVLFKYVYTSVMCNLIIFFKPICYYIMSCVSYQRPAFASHSSSSSDVNKFFEDCKYPPVLDLFSSEDGLDVQEALVSMNLYLLLACILCMYISPLFCCVCACVCSCMRERASIHVCMHAYMRACE